VPDGLNLVLETFSEDGNKKDSRQSVIEEEASIVAKPNSVK